MLILQITLASKNSQKAIIKVLNTIKKNPISKPLEQLDVVKASLIAGFGFGAKSTLLSI